MLNRATGWFDPAQTAEGAFTREDGSQVSVPLMNISRDEVLFTRSADFAAAKLAYAGGELGMFLVLLFGSLAELEAELDADTLDGIVSSLTPTSLPPTKPRFELDMEVDLGRNAPRDGDAPRLRQRGAARDRKSVV